jgi:hypothetical protein
MSRRQEGLTSQPEDLWTGSAFQPQPHGYEGDNRQTPSEQPPQSMFELPPDFSRSLPKDEPWTLKAINAYNTALRRYQHENQPELRATTTLDQHDSSFAQRLYEPQSLYYDDSQLNGPFQFNNMSQEHHNFRGTTALNTFTPGDHYQLADVPTTLDSFIWNNELQDPGTRSIEINNGSQPASSNDVSNKASETSWTSDEIKNFNKLCDTLQTTFDRWSEEYQPKDRIQLDTKTKLTIQTLVQMQAKHGEILSPQQILSITLSQANKDHRYNISHDHIDNTLIQGKDIEENKNIRRFASNLCSTLSRTIKKMSEGKLVIVTPQPSWELGVDATAEDIQTAIQHFKEERNGQKPMYTDLINTDVYKLQQEYASKKNKNEDALNAHCLYNRISREFKKLEKKNKNMQQEQ